ncbi:11S globulin seed storage protein G3-like protein [Tanacetum coccineum]
MVTLLIKMAFMHLDVLLELLIERRPVEKMSPSLFKAIVTQIDDVAVLCVQTKLQTINRGRIALIHPIDSYMVYFNKRFFLVSNSQNDQQQEGQPIRTWGRGQQGESQHKDSNNLFQGFDGEFLAEAFRVNQETRQTLKCENGQRRHIVVVEKASSLAQ